MMFIFMKKLKMIKMFKDPYEKLRAYNSSHNPKYPIMACHPDWGGCGRIYPLDDAPANCYCGALRGVFPYIQYIVYGKK